MEHVFETGDGRKLAVTEGGDPDGVPCLVHQGTPNSRLQYGPDVAVAREHGIRMITYDRPGYGGSTPQPGRTIADCAADARTICAGLGIERILSWGISGGGPHVLACAALLPDLIPAAASLASPAPFDAEGLDWFAGMGELNTDDYRLMVRDKVAARAKLEAERVEMLGANAEQVLEIITTLVSPVDAAVFTPELAQYFVDSAADGLGPGCEGWWEDGVADVEPWGFEFSDISIPVLLLHGRQDRFVPFGHGVWLAAQIPAVEARLTEEDGHLTLTVHHSGEIYDWLLERW
ncbi:MAG: alpha/beta hydrolase [Candidatus Dormibacteria bacterium]|jgi:pimeloyl-ACP methyl ester carboxylesterase